jgi:hypothetical protein
MTRAAREGEARTPRVRASGAKDAAPSKAATAQRVGAVWSYDERSKVLFASHPNVVNLSTRAEMEAYFDDGISFWRKQCKGQKIYIVVDYSNLTTNLDEIDFYAKQVKRVIDECAITVVRYNGDMLQRMASRMTAIQLHTPSNAYGSLEEALAVVRGLQRGTIQTAAR